MIDLELNSLIYGDDKPAISLLKGINKYSKVFINNINDEEIGISLLQNLKEMITEDTKIIIFLKKENLIKINALFEFILPELHYKCLIDIDLENYLIIFSNNIDDNTQFKSISERGNEYKSNNYIDSNIINLLIKSFLLDDRTNLFLNFKESIILDNALKQNSDLKFTYITRNMLEFNSINLFCKKNNQKINSIILA